jgi:hypothetical protein
MCALRACSVCECEENEVPEPWRAAEARSCGKQHPPEQECLECEHTARHCYSSRRTEQAMQLSPGTEATAWQP